MIWRKTSKNKKIDEESCKKNKGKCPLKYSSQKKVKNEEEVMKIFKSQVSKGAEGVMSKLSPYDQNVQII